ncbi:hypothetical protein B0A55_04379 [Friedmanniomyces simplex]|uniref:Major facilitator superfamily (MFS) profile domain-containing protein n=1 Tax=Friedmanniomyces simplex TaxID=329884 RepID=A0A4U0XJX4_9PEZI|nr:hypothetical protein B0A55_04379 [Friedmanniomyces simplex]
MACALSNNLPTLILGRVIAGLRSGALDVMTQLTIHQVVSPSHSTIAEQTVSSMYWLGAALGPIVGGAVTQAIGWRYIFWMNFPVGALAILTLPFLLRLKSNDRLECRELRKVDYTGWVLLAGGIAPVVLAISWAGSWYQWTFGQVLAPLIAGTVTLALFAQYFRYRLEPIILISIFSRAQGLASCFGALVLGMVFMSLAYFLPVYFMTAHAFDHTKTGLLLTPWTLGSVAAGLATTAVLTTTAIKGTYLWPVGWALVTAGTGLTTLLHASTAINLTIPIGLLTGLGLGLLFPIVTANARSAARTDDEHIHAVPLHDFFNTLGQTLGIAVGSCIFLKRLHSPVATSSYSSLESALQPNDAVAFIKTIQSMPVSQVGLKADIVGAYVGALRGVWVGFCILAGVCFALSFWYIEDTRWTERVEAGGQGKEGQSKV